MDWRESFAVISAASALRKAFAIGVMRLIWRGLSEDAVCLNFSRLAEFKHGVSHTDDLRHLGDVVDANDVRAV